jgi:hypothetical protein
MTSGALGNEAHELTNASVDPIEDQVEHVGAATPGIRDCSRCDGERVEIAEQQHVYVAAVSRPDARGLVSGHHDDETCGANDLWSYESRTMVRQVKTAALGGRKSGFRRSTPRSDESGGRNLDGNTSPPVQGAREGGRRIRAAAHISVTNKKNGRYVASPKERRCGRSAPGVKKPIRKVTEKAVCPGLHAPEGTSGRAMALASWRPPEWRPPEWRPPEWRPPECIGGKIRFTGR